MIFRRWFRTNQGIKKFGNTYWYKFNFTVQAGDEKVSYLIRKSAKTANKRHAQEVAEEHHRALRLGLIHPLDEWPRPAAPAEKAPSVKEFSARFLDFAKLHVKESSHRFYETCVNRVLLRKELALAPLDQVTATVIADYKQHMLDQQKSVTSINGDLRTIRRMLRLAHEWGVISRSPVIHELPGGKGRERVISFDEERRYLEAAGWNLRTLARLAADTGLRPNSELFCIEWQNICLEQIPTAPLGYLRVVDG
jgi:hypothetical protein